MTDHRRRPEVLRAARLAFHEDGYDGTGIRDIASRVGLKSGSLYHYTESKEQLLFDVLSAVQAPGGPAIERLLREPAPAPRRLEALVRHHVALTIADPIGIGLLVTELSSLGERYRQELVARLRRYRLGVEHLIQEGQEEGSVRPDLEPRLAALALLGALNWMYRWYRPDGRLSDVDLAEQLSRILLDGIAVPGIRATVVDLPPGVDLPTTGGRRRTEVLAAAADLFAERGYDATTTNDIAERLGMRKPSLYHYMRSKSDLLYTVVLEVQGPTLAMLDRINGTDAPPLSKLTTALGHHARYLIDNRVRTGLFLHQVRSLDAEQQAAIRDRDHSYTRGIQDLVAAAQDAGEVRAGADPAVTTRALLGAVNWLSQWYRETGTHPPDVVADAVVDAMVTGLLVGR